MRWSWGAVDPMTNRVLDIPRQAAYNRRASKRSPLNNEMRFIRAGSALDSNFGGRVTLMPRRIVVDTLVMLPLLILTAGLSPAAKLPLGEAVVVSPPNLSGPERKAVEMLLDEVEKRTQVRWQAVNAWPADDTPVVAVGPASKLSRFAGK